MTHTPTPPTGRTLSHVTTAAVVLVATAIIAVLAIMLLRTDTSGIDGALSEGRPADPPNFNLEVLNVGTLRPELAGLKPKFADGRLSNEDLRGTPVVLNLWASWCVPCREEAPDLKAVSESPQSRGVLFLGLNSLDGRTAARDFAREHQLTYPNIREYDNQITRAFGANAFPETFFLNAQGRIVGHVIGAISEQQLREGIAAARTGRPRAVDQGGEQRSADSQGTT